jgi:hypothetical protein
MKSITIEFDSGMKLMFHDKSSSVIIITPQHECAGVPIKEFEQLCKEEHKKRKIAEWQAKANDATKGS